MYFEKLRDNLSVTLVCPYSLGELLEKARFAWRDVCELPPEVRQQFAFPDHQSDRDPGYKERSSAQGGDDKFFFHYVPDTPALLEHYGLHALVSKYRPLQLFFGLAEKIEQQVYSLVRSIGKDFDKHIPGGFTEQLERDRNHMVYRYLFYTTKLPATEVAAAHFDRSAFTLQLFESGPGLQLLNWNEEWVDMRVYPQDILMFSGYKLEAATNGVVQKAWHRVVPKGATALSGTSRRTSIVAFVPLTNVPDYPKDTRSQDQKPGYQPRK